MMSSSSSSLWLSTLWRSLGRRPAMTSLGCFRLSSSSVAPGGGPLQVQVPPPSSFLVTSTSSSQFKSFVLSGRSLPLLDILDPLTKTPFGSPLVWRTPYTIPPPNKKTEVQEDPVSNKSPLVEDTLVPLVEKKAARLVVIRRIKMNKHKLKKLRKKMHFKWLRYKTNKWTEREKAYLDEKVGMIKAAIAFNAQEYVASVIRKAKEEPLERKWTDPLMPEWFREEGMAKVARAKRFQKVVNQYLNEDIKVKIPDP